MQRHSLCHYPVTLGCKTTYSTCVRVLVGCRSNVAATAKALQQPEVSGAMCRVYQGLQAAMLFRLQDEQAARLPGECPPQAASVVSWTVRYWIVLFQKFALVCTLSVSRRPAAGRQHCQLDGALFR